MCARVRACVHRCACVFVSLLFFWRPWRRVLTSSRYDPPAGSNSSRVNTDFHVLCGNSAVRLPLGKSLGRRGQRLPPASLSVSAVHAVEGSSLVWKIRSRDLEQEGPSECGHGRQQNLSLSGCSVTLVLRDEDNAVENWPKEDFGSGVKRTIFLGLCLAFRLSLFVQCPDQLCLLSCLHMLLAGRTVLLVFY